MDPVDPDPDSDPDRQHWVLGIFFFLSYTHRYKLVLHFLKLQSFVKDLLYSTGELLETVRHFLEVTLRLKVQIILITGGQRQRFCL